ncbi:hypothetical protein ACFRCI_34645 [Streptomyces sp. NPDC056638]
MAALRAPLSVGRTLQEPLPLPVHRSEDYTVDPMYDHERAALPAGLDRP